MVHCESTSTDQGNVSTVKCGGDTLTIDRQEQLIKATASLQEHLEPITFHTTSYRVTHMLTRHVLNWARDHRFVCQREAHMTLGPDGEDPDVPRYLDVTGIHPCGLRLVVEIDRSNRRRNLEKLALEADRGAIAIWVRWHGFCGLAIPDNVGLVQLHSQLERIPGKPGRIYVRQAGAAPPLSHARPRPRTRARPTPAACGQ